MGVNMSEHNIIYDAIIIGFGKGGKTIAGALGAVGKKVAVIEKSKTMYGGTCINVGCIPTKSLVHSAKEAAVFTDGKGYEEKNIIYKNAMEKKRTLVEGLREKNYQKLDKNPNITVIDGTAKFLSSHEVLVKTEKENIILEAEKIFINTGSVPIIPDTKGLKDNKYVYLSEDLLQLEELPKRLVIIGGGYIGVEFASIYANFGSKVSIIQHGRVFLPREDHEIAEAVKNNLEKSGIKLCLESEIKEVKELEGYAEIRIQEGENEALLYAEAVLVATGRRPNTKDLNLEAAGVEIDNRGGIITNSERTTTNPNIFAMGDVVGGLQFTYISLDDFRIVRSKIFGQGEYTLEKRGAVPYSVFLDPPFSRVGMSEKEAIEAGYEIKIAKLPAKAIPKAQVLENTDGLLKAIIDVKTERILGAHLFCEESHELINLVKLAMDGGLKYSILRDMIFTHPTMGEALNDLFQI